MFKEKIFVLALFSTYLFSLAADDKNTSFSALYAFGDSVLDTGNNNFLLTLLKGNYWPYGWNFDYKIPTGRFGNGRVFTDLVGGSGIDDLTSKTLRVLSAADQIKDFKEYLKKLKKIVKRKKKVKEIISNAVFLISEGNNDLGYFIAPAVLRLQSPNLYTSRMVGWTKQFLQDLYDLGARKFAVLGVMPVGCLPIHRAEFGAFGWCNSYLNKVTQDFNSKLQKGLTSYAVEYEFRGAKFVYVDMYGKLMDLINHPKAYGFTEERKACCCMPYAIIPCFNPDKHIFYDFAHPTQKAYQVITKALVYQIAKGLA
ncbi:GDSL esterase/lipase EXL6 isoform X2 [Capsella rubella]|uniref:GDSL esterase/lipase EXL6 isoform X2 n=1 Tax=Capsella rubella TaxID=81985 RepID=UPI000CD4FC5E|nr:GDSL esterase/lipase EXL6 isoform X2 [Capsella rubella]